MQHPGEQVYALRLWPCGADMLAGEIEQVLSGERRRFHSGAELVEQLRSLQAGQSPPPGCGADAAQRPQ